MDIKVEIGRHTDEAEQIITSYLPEEKGYQKTVIEAMNYSFLAGGKRLRPILMLETYRLFGGKSKVIEPFMAAIEMIHTYSLCMMIFRRWTMMNTAVAKRQHMWCMGRQWRSLPGMLF